jgi:DNA-directed RNA polymerase specialized sigma24 family protein
VREAENPEAELLAAAQSEIVRQAVAGLSPDFREVALFSEMEDLSYKEIAIIAAIPIWYCNVAAGAGPLQTKGITLEIYHQ